MTKKSSYLISWTLLSHVLLIIHLEMIQFMNFYIYNKNNVVSSCLYFCKHVTSSLLESWKKTSNGNKKKLTDNTLKMYNL